MIRYEGVKYALLSLFLLSAIDVAARGSWRPERRFEAELWMGLDNNQTWTIEPAVSYMPCKWVGIRMGIGLTRQYNQPLYVAEIGGLTYDLNDGDENVTRLLFKPSVRLVSPALFRNADQGLSLHLFAEPGLTLAVPANETLHLTGNVSGHPSLDLPNRDGRWLFGHLRGGVRFCVERLSVGVAYEYSNLDIYSCRRNVLVNGHRMSLPDRQNTHVVFAFAAYSF